MEYRALPNGQRISTIGIGVGNYGSEKVSLNEIERIFQTAFDNGVNFFDTCMSTSQPAEAIARAIHGKRTSLVMQNHLCVGYPQGQYNHLLKLNEVKDAFTGELRKYGTDYSDIGTIHFIDEEADLQRIIDTGVLDYAFELKKQGILRNVAFSSHTPSIALKALDAGKFDVMFFGINAGYDYVPGPNGLTLSEERVHLYNKCAQRGIAITVMKVYNNGQLLDGRTSPFGRAMNPYQCLQYALDRPGVVSCLAGAVTADEMAQTLRFYDMDQAERDYSFLKNTQKQDMLGKCTYCGHCMPCPQGIEINAVNRYYDLSRAGDPLAKEHYRNLSVHADACISCGRCMEFCPFHVNMPERMNEIKRYFRQ